MAGKRANAVLRKCQGCRWSGVDFTRLLPPLAIFAVVFAVALWQLRRDQQQGIAPEVTVARFNSKAARDGSTIGFAVAVVVLLAGAAEGNLVIIIGGIGLIAFQLWRRSRA